MKQKLTKHILSLCLLLSLFASNVYLITAQTSPKNGFNPLPSNAVEGSTDERRNAYNSLSETGKTQASAAVKQLVDNAAPVKQSNTFTDLSFVDNSGNSNVLSSRASVEDSSDFYARIAYKPCLEEGCRSLTTISADADADGLTDSFENSLADGFTPFYFVSSGENNGTGFARFNDSVPQTVSQVFGSTPPISHFRVKPLGFFNRNDGIRYGLIQINYHTLWNKDDGLVGSPFCVVDPIIDATSLGNHNLDNEFSAILVAAPVVGRNYDTNLQNYKLYEVYTAAHLDTFFDQSRYYNLSTPRPFGSHIQLDLRVPNTQHTSSIQITFP